MELHFGVLGRLPRTSFHKPFTFIGNRYRYRKWYFCWGIFFNLWKNLISKLFFFHFHNHLLLYRETALKSKLYKGCFFFVRCSFKWWFWNHLQEVDFIWSELVYRDEFLLLAFLFDLDQRWIFFRLILLQWMDVVIDDVLHSTFWVMSSCKIIRYRRRHRHCHRHRPETFGWPRLASASESGVDAEIGTGS